jgi:cytochrome b561
MTTDTNVQPKLIPERPSTNWRNTTSHYGPLSIWLHWAMLIVIVAVYATMELRGQFPKGSDAREMMKTWHFMLGLSVFLLVWIRLVAHMTDPAPRIQPDPPIWQEILGKGMHVALYALMIGMPLAGWVLLSAEGKPIPFFGLHLPALIAENKTLAESVKEIHETGGTIGYFLIGLHAAAALFHHYVSRDNTLRRMLPNGD